MNDLLNEDEFLPKEYSLQRRFIYFLCFSIFLQISVHKLSRIYMEKNRGYLQNQINMMHLKDASNVIIPILLPILYFVINNRYFRTSSTKILYSTIAISFTNFVSYTTISIINHIHYDYNYIHYSEYIILLLSNATSCIIGYGLILLIKKLLKKNERPA